MGEVPTLTFDVTTRGCRVGQFLDFGYPLRVLCHQGVPQCLDVLVHRAHDPPPNRSSNLPTLYLLSSTLLR